MSDLLARARLVFWDFDGVIKESFAVKTDAFARLFSPFGEVVVRRVCAHHRVNGGMSRFEKIPIYLEWAGQVATEENVADYCQRFSAAVMECVIAAPWVPGVEEILRANPYRQEFVLVTATPQGEIESILKALALRGCFSEVFGAPTKKGEAIRKIVFERRMQPVECLMVGDARADSNAANENGIPFMLRRHADNRDVFRDYGGESVEDFVGL